MAHGEADQDREYRYLAWQYRRRRSLVTVGELPFYRMLWTLMVKKTDRRWVVMPKVSLSDIVDYVPTQEEERKRTRYGTRPDGLKCMLKLHVDFLLMEFETLLPRCVIELDDSSHRRRRPGGRRTTQEFNDGVKNRALESACVPIVRQDWQREYDGDELWRRIKREVLRAQAARAERNLENPESR